MIQWKKEYNWKKRLKLMQKKSYCKNINIKDRQYWKKIKWSDRNNWKNKSIERKLKKKYKKKWEYKLYRRLKNKWSKDKQESIKWI